MASSIPVPVTRSPLGLRGFRAWGGKRSGSIGLLVGLVLLVCALATGALRAQGQAVPAQSGAPMVPDRPTAAAPALPPVTAQDLLDGLKNPSRWLTYSGDYTGRRHSPLKQITPGNADPNSAAR